MRRQYPEPWVVRDSDGNVLARYCIRPTRAMLARDVNAWPFSISFEM